MGIEYLERWEINTEKWDNCVKGGNHVLAYALSGYLDGVCDQIEDYSKFSFEDDNLNQSEMLGQWGGLILNDYEAVFPLPWRQKMGLKYIFQPKFCQQLGLFGNPKSLTTEDFLKAIPKKFVKIHLQVNPYFGKPNKSQVKTNYILECPHVPEEKFNKDAIKNIKKCTEAGVFYKQPLKFSDVIKIYHDAWGDMSKFKWFDDYEGFELACINMEKEERTYSVIAKDESYELLGGAIFLISPNRIHYVCAGPTAEGRKIGIMHGIINHVATLFPNHEIDFEGSSIPSVAEFYKKFNPKNEPFYIIERNLLTNL